MTWLANRVVTAIYNDKAANACWAWFEPDPDQWLLLQGDAWETSTTMAVLATHAKANNRYVSIDVYGNRVDRMYVW
ncbi:MAG TPA: hypothetical protein VF101_12755 [Gaiellaceae bacterium]